jgi:hypothetical protein
MPRILASKPYESGDKSPHSKKDGSLELVFQQPARVEISTSRRSRRQNVAQGEASVASGTLGSIRLFTKARFSGRKTLSPAKAGLREFFDDTQGGAPLHFVPLRLPWATFCRQLRWLVELCELPMLLAVPKIHLLASR